MKIPATLASAVRPRCYAYLASAGVAIVVIPLRGVSGVRARKAAEGALEAMTPHLLPSRLACCALTIVERDESGAVTCRMVWQRTSRRWITPKTGVECRRCAGHGIESSLDGHCWACGREGGLTRVVHEIELREMETRR